MTDPSEGRQIPLLAAQGALILGGLSGLLFEWFVGSAAGQDVEWGVRDLPVSASVLALGLLSTVIAAAAVRATGSAHWRQIGAVAAGGTAVWLACGSLVVEHATAALSPAFVPKSVQRLTFNVASGVAIWLMVAVTALLAASMYLPPRIPAPSFALAKRYRGSLMMGVVGACAVGLLLAGRYETWIDLQLPDGPRQFAGWTLPYVGVGSFTIAVLGAVSCIAAASGLGEMFLLPGAAAAWLGACSTAFVHLGLQSFVEFDVLHRLLGLLPDEAARYTGTQATLQPGNGPLMYFAGNILVLVLVAVAVLRLPRPKVSTAW